MKEEKRKAEPSIPEGSDTNLMFLSLKNDMYTA